jgi:uncharacterized protein (DUF305 family)
MAFSQSRAVTAIVVAGVVASACTSAPRAAQSPAERAPQPYTAADVHFMSAMIAHHAQAIDIARWAPTHGASSSLQVLAERVINAQQDEIAVMQTWLRDRRLPVPEPQAMGAMATGQHQHRMAGMLTAEQLKQLDEARGREFDRLFLTLMIQHHRGAVTMVEELFHSQGAALDDTVYKLASDISADQSSEIERMQKMLFTLTTGIPVQ